MAEIVATTNAITADGQNVDYIREDLSRFFPKYDLIRDAIDGSIAVKERGDIYLPRPNAMDTSPENFAQYKAYKTRAVFYGVTGRTLKGLSGQVFNIDPNIKVPPVLDPVVKDANGSGISLIQQANEVENLVIAYGRSGLFVDFPRTNGVPVSRAQQDSGEIRPNIMHYEPWSIINWRTIKRGGKHYLSLIVLSEVFEEETGLFGMNKRKQYRVLRLENNVYHQYVYREGITAGQFLNVPAEHSIPTDFKGKPLDYLPFTFIGAVNNDASIDSPPLFDLADLNMAHYRNSADYEDSTYMVGQPTPVATGLTKDWVDTVLKGRIEIGSRAVIPLPVGAAFNIAQTVPNSQVFEAMEAKERQMVALGAKLVEQTTVQRTATEASQEEAGETSVLASITKNVSSGYVFALEICSIFAGGVTENADAKDTTIIFELNTEFSLATATPDEIRSTIDAWQKEAISWTEMRGKLRRTGVASLDDKKAKKEIQDDTAKEMEFNSSNGLNPDGSFNAPTNTDD